MLALWLLAAAGAWITGNAVVGIAQGVYRGVRDALVVRRSYRREWS